MWISGVTAAMITLEFLDVGMNTVNKAAMNQGMSQYILVVYSNFLALFLLLSSSSIFYRKRPPPPLTWSIICRILLLSVLGCSGQVFTYIGVAYSSPILNSAMSNLTPAFTFILSIMLRMERLDLKSNSSLAKSMGTVVLITGGLVVTLYKGLPMASLRSTDKSLNSLLLLTPGSNWAVGGFFLAAHSFILSLMLVMQTWIIRDFPSELIMTLFNAMFVTILSAIVTFIAEKDLNAWRIRADIELVSIMYSAAFAVTLRTVAHTWACHKKGPVYISMFKPLGIVIAVFMGVSFLGDTLYLGSVIGAIIIATGFYAVIWGKTQEEKTMEIKEKRGVDSTSSSPKVPLLQTESLDV